MANQPPAAVMAARNVKLARTWLREDVSISEEEAAAIRAEIKALEARVTEATRR